MDNQQRRIDAQVTHLREQRQAYVRDRIEDVARIAMSGPDVSDSEFVKAVFLMVFADLAIQ